MTTTMKFLGHGDPLMAAVTRNVLSEEPKLVKKELLKFDHPHGDPLFQEVQAHDDEAKLLVKEPLHYDHPHGDPLFNEVHKHDTDSRLAREALRFDHPHGDPLFQEVQKHDHPEVKKKKSRYYDMIKDELKVFMSFVGAEYDEEDLL